MKLLKIYLMMLFFTASIFAKNLDMYLVKLSGRYHVSLIKDRLINNNICPDPYYQESQNWLYKNNNKHCHVFDAYIFYPTYSNSRNYIKYFDYANWSIVSGLKGVSPKNIDLIQKKIKQIAQVNSYVLDSQPIVDDKKFPLIVFQPGYDLNSVYYENCTGPKNPDTFT